MPLNISQRRMVRRTLWTKLSTSLDKATINAAGDAIYDLLQAPSTRNAVRNAVNTATQALPGSPTLTNAELKLVAAGVFLELFTQDKEG